MITVLYLLHKMNNLNLIQEIGKVKQTQKLISHKIFHKLIKNLLHQDSEYLNEY